MKDVQNIALLFSAFANGEKKICLNEQILRIEKILQLQVVAEHEAANFDAAVVECRARKQHADENLERATINLRNAEH